MLLKTTFHTSKSSRAYASAGVVRQKPGAGLEGTPSNKLGFEARMWPYENHACGYYFRTSCLEKVVM